MNAADKRELLIKTVLTNPYIPHKPTAKQAEGLIRMDKELFFGGAGGGGKSDWLLMGALMFVDVPTYASIIFMETISNLNKPEALLTRAQEWLSGTDAVWKDKLRAFFFPSGARLDFGFMAAENDKFLYKTAAYQYIGFDEVTQFSETQYTYLFSRLRRQMDGVRLPLRVRSAANPDGPGMLWVKKRFVDTGLFIPAKIGDNPHIDQAAYRDSLSYADPLTRKRIEDGEWIMTTGQVFKREWFHIENSFTPMGLCARYWDLAATKEGKGDPDFSVGLKGGFENDGGLVISHRIKVKEAPGEMGKIMKKTAKNDGQECVILIEEEPGSSGKYTIEYFKEKLNGYKVIGIRSTGQKSTRAVPVADFAFMNGIKLLQAGWNEDFLVTTELFPNTGHDDDVDALSGLFNWLNDHYGGGNILTGTMSDVDDKIPYFMRN